MRQPIISKTPYGLLVQLDHDWLADNNFSMTFTPDDGGYNMEIDDTKKLDWNEKDFLKYLKRVNEKRDK